LGVFVGVATAARGAIAAGGGAIASGLFSAAGDGA